MSAQRTAAYRVSATSANLGPGFDSLALCLDLYDDVRAVVDLDASGCEVAITGEGAGDLPRDERHVIVATMRRAWRSWGLDDAARASIRLSCTNAIPQGRGLGSSAAAVVAGLSLASALASFDESRRVGADAMLAYAARLDGHADNVAACIHGGLTLTWDDGGPTAVRLPDPVGVAILALVSPLPLSTTSSRAALPTVVPLADAAANAARTALLVQALSGRPDLLMPATEDRLHQAARGGLMPETLNLVDRLRGHGVPAFVSGAGPSVLCVVPDAEISTARAGVEGLIPVGWEPRLVSVGQPAHELPGD